LTSGLRQVKEPERLQGLASRFKPTEELLAEVAAAAKPGLEWCVLRGGYFMNNLALMFGAALKGGAPAIAFPRVTCAPVDTRDIGDAAAALCLLPSEDFAKSYQGAALECSGPEELGLLPRGPRARQGHRTAGGLQRDGRGGVVRG